MPGSGHGHSSAGSPVCAGGLELEGARSRCYLLPTAINGAACCTPMPCLIFVSYVQLVVSNRRARDQSLKRHQRASPGPPHNYDPSQGTCSPGSGWMFVHTHTLHETKCTVVSVRVKLPPFGSFPSEGSARAAALPLLSFLRKNRHGKHCWRHSE